MIYSGSPMAHHGKSAPMVATFEATDKTAHFLLNIAAKQQHNCNFFLNKNSIMIQQ